MADFYGTEAGFAAYCLARGYTAAAGDVEPALLRGSTALDAIYGSDFSGVKTGGRAQLRAWPRTGAYDAEGLAIADDETPIEVEHATYEATRQELLSPGSMQPVVTMAAKIKRVKVEGAVEVEYADTSLGGSVPQLTIIDGILAPLLGGGLDYNSGLFGIAERI